MLRRAPESARQMPPPAAAIRWKNRSLSEARPANGEMQAAARERQGPARYDQQLRSRGHAFGWLSSRASAEDEGLGKRGGRRLVAAASNFGLFRFSENGKRRLGGRPRGHIGDLQTVVAERETCAHEEAATEEAWDCREYASRLRMWLAGKVLGKFLRPRFALMKGPGASRPGSCPRLTHSADGDVVMLAAVPP
jgi:hypothetical protein